MVIENSENIGYHRRWSRRSRRIHTHRESVEDQKNRQDGHHRIFLCGDINSIEARKGNRKKPTQLPHRCHSVKCDRIFRVGPRSDTVVDNNFPAEVQRIRQSLSQVPKAVRLTGTVRVVVVGGVVGVVIGTGAGADTCAGTGSGMGSGAGSGAGSGTGSDAAGCGGSGGGARSPSLAFPDGGLGCPLASSP